MNQDNQFWFEVQHTNFHFFTVLWIHDSHIGKLVIFNKHNYDLHLMIINFHDKAHVDYHYNNNLVVNFVFSPLSLP